MESFTFPISWPQIDKIHSIGIQDFEKILEYDWLQHANLEGITKKSFH